MHSYALAPSRSALSNTHNTRSPRAVVRLKPLCSRSWPSAAEELAINLVSLV